MKAVILDMYGVIMKDPEGGLMPFVRRYFPDASTDGVYYYWKQANVGEISSLDFFKHLGFRGDLSFFEREYLDSIEIDGGFYEAAADIGKHNKMALLTNDLSEWSNYLRRKFNLDNYFETIIVSSEVGIKKPDRRIFELALNRLCLPPSDCVFTDDRRRNLAAAQSLGIGTVLYNSRGVDYGGVTVYNFSELTCCLKRDFMYN